MRPTQSAVESPVKLLQVLCQGFGLRKLWKLQVIIAGGDWVACARPMGSAAIWARGLTIRSSEASEVTSLEAAGLLLGIASTTDVQLVHLVLEGCSFQSEALCCPALAGHPPGGGSQSLDDDMPLGLFKS